MAASDEVRDPWSWVAGGLTGGLAWALIGGPVGAVVGAGIGAAVFGVKVVTGALTGGPRRRRTQRERRLPVTTRTPEAAWLDRAQSAQETFDEVAESAREGPIAERVRTFGDQTAESLASLHRLAGQASAVRSAMARIDRTHLVRERDRVMSAARGADPAVLAERERALNAIQSQLDSYARLDSTLTMLIARLESGTLGIEGLVARLAEVIAIAETSTTAADGTHLVDELAHELEGLRAGLVEAESVTTRAMKGLPPLPSQAPGSVPARMRRRAGQ